MARRGALSPAELLALRFALDERGLIVRTNEPVPQRGPRLSLTNTASLAVARKLGLVEYARQLNILDAP